MPRYVKSVVVNCTDGSTHEIAAPHGLNVPKDRVLKAINAGMSGRPATLEPLPSLPVVNSPLTLADIDLFDEYLNALVVFGSAQQRYRCAIDLHGKLDTAQQQIDKREAAGEEVADVKSALVAVTERLLKEIFGLDPKEDKQ